MAKTAQASFRSKTGPRDICRHLRGFERLYPASRKLAISWKLLFPRGGLIIHSPHAEKIRTALLSFLLVFFSVVSIFAGEKEKSFGCAIVSEITSIYDGDTFRCNISGYPEIIGERIPIRINGIDTPELRDNRDHVKQLARQAKQHTVQRLREARKIELCNMKRGKYFRIVADVFVDGQDLGQELIQKGLAKPYDGGKKPDWL